MRKALTLLSLVLGCSGIIHPSSECSETEIPEYNRDDWGRWIDEDDDCQDTRQEVLISESTVPVTFEDDKNCQVASGRWIDLLTGITITDPSEVDVDHTVALKDAHDSGAYAWGDHLREDFFNNLKNPDHLQATSRSGNRSKGSRGPDEWLPPNPSYRCEYVRSWLEIKKNYGLILSPDESSVIMFHLKVCERGEIPALPQD